MPKIERYIPMDVEWEQRPPLEVGKLHVIKDIGRITAVAFHCPCGCGDECFLYVYGPGCVDQSKKSCPTWEWHGNSYLIWPSVHSMTDRGGCGAHFYILADGTVQWC